MTRDEAVRKCSKLLRLAQSTNVHEAALAASRAQEIMVRFEIETAALSLDSGGGGAASAEADEPIEDFGRKGASLDVMDGRAYTTWLNRLASGVAYSNGCRIYLSRDRDGKATIQIVGRPSDVDTVRYLYTYLAGQIELLARRDGKGCGRTWISNFRIGAVSEVLQRISLERTKVEDAVRAESASSTALVRIDRAIACVSARGGQVKTWMDQNMNLRAGRACVGGRIDASARAAGRSAASSIDMRIRRTGLLGSG